MGAFTSVEAERSVSVNTAGDANAYLKFSSDNEFVTNNNGDELTIDLGGPSNGEGGRGFSQNAASVVPEVFAITHQGQDDIELSLEYFGKGKSSSKSKTPISIGLRMSVLRSPMTVRVTRSLPVSTPRSTLR